MGEPDRRDARRRPVLERYVVLDGSADPALDALARFAARSCRSPVALVTLVDGDHQWLKGRTGTDETHMPRSSSICQHLLGGDALLVIPDLTADARTAANPLVTEAPHYRFYAGAPLVVDGHALGGLCVLDAQPRPEGLSRDEEADLRALAAQAAAHLALRRQVAERDAALLASAQADSRLRALFDTMGEGFFLAELVRDAAGQPADWRYLDVNSAFSAMVRLRAATAVGAVASVVAPKLEPLWLDLFAEAVAQRRAINFEQRVDVLGRWYGGRVFPVEEDRFGVIFHDITEARSLAARQRALLEIGEQLRSVRTVAEMTEAAARAVGTALGVTRATYGVVDAATERVTIEAGWTAPGIAHIAGDYRFEDFGRIRDELAAGEPLVIDDVDRDPRTRDDPAPMHGLAIAALVNMPVRERGRTVAVFIVQTDVPHAWTETELAFIRTVADRLESSIAQLRAEQQQELVNGEIMHRTKNLLTLVQAVAKQTLRGIAEQDRVAAFDQRLAALGAAYDLLMRANWQAAELGDVARTALATVAGGDRAAVSGPALRIGDRAALNVSLLVHELATNATKYGALSRDEGAVTLGWQVEDGADGALLRLRWQERDGPPVHPPAAAGFGSRLIGRGLAGNGGATLDYAADGFTADFVAPIAELAGE